MRSVILDTDVGSDVDDALALALLLGANGLALKAITTVYGNTKVRAQIASHLCALAQRDISIFAGEGMPLSGKDIWSSGREGENFKGLERYSISERDAVDFLTVDYSNLDDLEILAIGPLTNIAKAITQSLGFTKNVKALWVMGGNFSSEKAEHNFACDSKAAQIVFGSGIPIKVLDLPSAQKTLLGPHEILRIKSAGKLGPTLYAEAMSWITPRNQDWTIPHDPMLALSYVRPELFDFSEAGYVEISDDGKSRWSGNENGHVHRVSPKEPKKAVDVMIDYLAAIN